MNNDNLFLGYFEINGKYNIKCNLLDILQVRQNIPSVWRDILYKSSKPKPKHTDIVFIGDEIYNPVSLNTRAIYNVQSSVIEYESYIQCTIQCHWIRELYTMYNPVLFNTRAIYNVQSSVIQYESYIQCTIQCHSIRELYTMF